MGSGELVLNTQVRTANLEPMPQLHNHGYYPVMFWRQHFCHERTAIPQLLITHYTHPDHQSVGFLDATKRS